MGDLNRKGEALNGESEFLVFLLGKQSYAVNVAKIINIAVWSEEMLTRVPGSDSFVIGTVYFRDQHISAIDLSNYLLGDAAVQVSNDNRLILTAQICDRTVGFIIDGVTGMRKVTWKDFVPYSGEFDSDENSAIVGTISTQEEIILVPDLESILAKLDPSVSIGAFKHLVESNLFEGQQNLRILYCEDSKIIQKVTAESLEKAGFSDLTICATGEAGLREVKERLGSGEQFDIIISDIEMPQMDGISFCREVKSIPEMQKVPFLFFSSMVTEQTKKLCHDAGAESAHSKPEIHLMINSLKERLTR